MYKNAELIGYRTFVYDLRGIIVCIRNVPSLRVYQKPRDQATNKGTLYFSRDM